MDNQQLSGSDGYRSDLVDHFVANAARPIGIKRLRTERPFEIDGLDVGDSTLPGDQGDDITALATDFGAVPA